MKPVAGARVAAIGFAIVGCGSQGPPPLPAPTCDQFPASLGDLSLDADTTALLNASASLLNLANNIDASLENACAGIATDLMIGDTWTAKGPLNGGTFDAEVTEACSQASRGIAAAFAAVQGDAGVDPKAPCILSVSGGGCALDPNVQATCVATCSGGASCAPPTVAADCDPAAITGQCNGTCMPSGTCRGSVSAPSQCHGSCSAQCSGECDGTASNPVACSGKCSGNCQGTCSTSTAASGICAGSCTGTCAGPCVMTGMATVQCSGDCKGACSGDCTLDPTATVACGAGVPCTGGCAGDYTALSCAGQLAEPTCGADAGCQASCQSIALISASCAPPTVVLVCTGTPGAGTLQTLATTLQANMPMILEIAETQGPLAMVAAAALAKIGASFDADAGSDAGESVACAAAAEKAVSTAQNSISLAVAVGARVGAAASGAP